MTATQSDQVEVPWERCSKAACSGVPAQGGVCLGHLSRRALDKALDPVRRGRGLDARGVTITAELLGKIIEAAPRDVEDRPKLPKARFDHATFEAGVGFDGIVFAKDVSFDRAGFGGDAAFAGARFHGNARFAGATVAGRALFDEASFGGQAWFGGASFSGPASFRETQFAHLAWFGRSVFASDADFDVANFCGDATFDGVSVAGDARFARATFRGEVRMVDPSFSRDPVFEETSFLGKGGAPRVAMRQAGWSGGNLASWPSRAAAALIDQAAASLLAVAPIPIGAFLEQALLYSGAQRAATALGALLALAFVVRNLLAQGRTGQTLGKRRMGIKVLRVQDGRPPGRTRSILRQVAHVFDSASLMAGWLWPLWDAKHQTFSDKLCRTVVVRA